MSAKASGIVWESALPRAEKYVLLALADHAKEDGSDVYPSLARVEWKTGYSETQVREIMSSLRKRAILILVKKGGNGPRDTDKYRIDLAALPQLQAFEDWAIVNGKRGTKNAPIDSNKGPKSEPLKGAVPAKKGCGSSEKRGPETEPEPRTTRTVNTEPLFGNAASALPPGSSQKAEAAKPQDQRFPEICEAIRKSWPKDCKCEISQADAGAINRMLLQKHAWTAEELGICVVFRFWSDNVNPTESVKAWIGAVSDYQSGPQDKYGKEKLTQFSRSELREQAKAMLYGAPIQPELKEEPHEEWRVHVGNSHKSETSAAVAAGVGKFLRGKAPVGAEYVPGAATPRPGDPS